MNFIIYPRTLAINSPVFKKVYQNPIPIVNYKHRIINVVSQNSA